jgi:hypothetical protein
MKIYYHEKILRNFNIMQDIKIEIMSSFTLLYYISLYYAVKDYVFIY